MTRTPNGGNTGATANERLEYLLRLAGRQEPKEDIAVSLARLLLGTLDALTHSLYVIDTRSYGVILANGPSGLDPLSHQLTCHAVTHGLPLPCSEYGQACPLLDVVETGKPATADHVHFDEEGGARICEVHAYPVTGAEGEVSHIIEYNLDITEQRNAEEQLHLLGTAIESVANAIFVTDREGKIEWVNGAFTRLFGYTRAEAVGRHPKFLRSGLHDDGFYEQMLAQVSAGSVWRGRMVHRHRDGRSVVVQQTVTPLADQKGEAAHFVVVQDDLTSLEETEEQLRHASRYDSLTGLPNRKALVERLNREGQRLADGPSEFVVLAVDLDHFREFNETFGRSVGDALLRAVGERLALCLEAGDFLARTGGDEFGVFHRHSVGPSEVERLSDCVLEVLSEPLVLDGRHLGLTATLGIAVGGAGESESLLQKAEIALSRARAEGRSRSRVYSPEVDEEIRGRMELAFGLRTAIARHELFLEYQPKVDLATGEMIGVEALLRWLHPRFGRIGPSEFIDAMERIRLSEPITDWVLRSACAEAMEWRAIAGRVLALAVNVPPSELLQKDFPGRVGRIIEETELPVAALELEVTEREFMLTTPIFLENVRQLRAMGIRLAIDDFGAGSSSFEFLRRVPVQILKIAPHFVRNVCSDEGDHAIVRSLVVLAERLGMSHVVEGVETAEQLELLSTDECHVAQGFHLCPPVAPSEIRRILVENHGQILNL